MEPAQPARVTALPIMSAGGTEKRGAEGDLPVHSTVLHSHRIHPSRNARLTMCLAKDHVMLSVWESVKSKRLHVNNAGCCEQTAVNRQDAHTFDRLTCCMDSNTALSLA